jgi:hypothetical protein
MPRETVINPPLKGAARTIDMAYPAPQSFPAGAGLGIQWFNRQGFTPWDMGTTTSFGAPPAGSGTILYRGRVAIRVTGSGTSGGFYSLGGNLNINFPQDQLTAAFNDDVACWRVMAILAYDAGLGSGDTGLEVGANINYDVIAATSPGFRLGPSGPTSAAFQVRQNGGGALTINQTVSTTIDTTDWNAYELRFIGATDKRPGLVKAFLNGAQVSQASWGPGTVLPGWANGAQVGYRVCIGNRGATGVYIPLVGLQLSAAATEDGLL